MNNLQQDTKRYLTLSLISAVGTVLLVNALQSWQPDTSFATSNIEALKMILFLSFIPLGFLLLAIGSQNRQKYLKVFGIFLIFTEITVIFLLG